MKTSVSFFLSLFVALSCFAHELDGPNGDHHAPFQLALNEAPAPRQIPSSSKYANLHQLMQKSFGAFDHKVKTRSDSQHFYVESNGIPEHQMMVGIRAWQQQVPLPQPYVGNNAWRIPLKPVPAKQKLSTRNNFFRGAIALAVNGVPIFNPIKNDGRTDTFLAGELDKWGGHGGRADDYHYHLPPLHLQSKVGPGMPVAFALDGYPIFGLTEPDGSPVKGLDALNGHHDAEGNYHYHSSRRFPYLNGGFHGEVRVAGGQVDPQPRAQPLRPASRPLRGAVITDFSGTLKDGYKLTYSLNGRSNHIHYKTDATSGASFRFIDSSSNSRTENYQPRQRRGPKEGRPPRKPRK